MWRKCHSFPCKSVATNSCHGGCWDISWMKQNYTRHWEERTTNPLCPPKVEERKMNKCIYCEQGDNIVYYQWWETVICMPPEDRKSAMGACIRSSKCLAKWMNCAPWRIWKWRIRACNLILLLHRRQAWVRSNFQRKNIVQNRENCVNSKFKEL